MTVIYKTPFGVCRECGRGAFAVDGSWRCVFCRLNADLFVLHRLEAEFAAGRPA